MNKAFFLVLVGVLIDSEPVWQQVEKPMLERVVGKEVADRIGSSIGLNATQVFEKARQLDASVRSEDVVAGYAALEPEVYSHAPITAGVDALIDTLASNGFRIGLVTQPAQSAIDIVLQRIASAAKIDRTLSLFQHPQLRPKPEPDGYIDILREFTADPKHSCILEDSNTGIRAAHAAGAFVIGFRGNLIEGYEQTGADQYAESIEDVARIVLGVY